VGFGAAGVLADGSLPWKISNEKEDA
jgi:hypothetical protein